MSETTRAFVAMREWLDENEDVEEYRENHPRRTLKISWRKAPLWAARQRIKDLAAAVNLKVQHHGEGQEKP